MKKIIIYLCISVLCCSCNKFHTSDDNLVLPFDSTFILVVNSIVDTNQSFLDVKDEFKTLIDSMRYYAEFNPNEGVRIRVKSMAAILASLVLNTDSIDHISPEEMRYFIDSLVVPLDEVKSVWYFEADTAENGPFLCQDIIRLGDDKMYVTYIRVFLRPEGDVISFIYPDNAIYAASIMFAEEDFKLKEGLSYNQNNAISVGETDRMNSLFVSWGQEVVDNMLKNKMMFFAYISDNYDGTNAEECYKDHLLQLYKFQEKYNIVKSNGRP